MLYSEIEQSIAALKPEGIADDRKPALLELAAYIQSKVSAGQDVRINFICTHNSRRSHLSQVWAQAMSVYYKLQNVFCYSAGTEATALFPMILETLQRSGFQFETTSKSENPHYQIKFGDMSPILGFSKTLDEDFNPKSGFAAVMTCSQADEGCPFVPGAEKRIPITFDDPKAFDNTPQQAEKYMERSLQIATEMKFVFAQIKR